MNLPLTFAVGGSSSWLLWAMQETRVLASLGWSLVIMSTLVTSDPTLVVWREKEKFLLEIHQSMMYLISLQQSVSWALPTERWKRSSSNWSAFENQSGINSGHNNAISDVHITAIVDTNTFSLLN